MKRNPAVLAGESFDLLVVGGGIVGAGIARDAALRGLRVAIVDQADWSSGTSSRSSKLIHGGFRYLEQGAFHLIAEACRERAILRRVAPHLVKPLPFLFPVYQGGRRSLLTMRLGMTLYDLLALYRNTHPHQTLSAEAALTAEPTLAPDGLRGAIRFYDCQEDDARLCVENILHAAALGAVCCNYCRVIALERADQRIESIRLRDQLAGQEFTVRADAVVNAAGPWVERVAGLATDGKTGPPVRLSPTKGVHILVPRLTRKHAIAMQDRRDGRILFILPWHDCSLVGTTDTDFTGEPADARATDADIAYLLDAISQATRTTVSRDEILTTFAGIRPLLAGDSKRPSARSREHRIVQQADNFLTIAGGKYTTYRAMAQEAVDRVYRLLNRRSLPCRTAHEPIPPPVRETSGATLCDNPQVLENDITRAAREEMATSVADVMWRRTGLALSRCAGESTALRVGALLATELGWNEAAEAQSVREYLQSLAFPV
jgi:glycerol-3-phosphate dehydrogenase